MHFKDLHEFIEYLETKNDLVRIERQVSSELEITEIADRMVKSGGPALLFENVLGSKFPLIINLFGTHQRVAWALGVDSTDEIVSRVKKILGIINNPPKSLMDKLGTLTNLAGIAKTQPKLVKKAPISANAFPGVPITSSSGISTFLNSNVPFCTVR